MTSVHSAADTGSCVVPRGPPGERASDLTNERLPRADGCSWICLSCLSVWYQSVYIPYRRPFLSVLLFWKQTRFRAFLPPCASRGLWKRPSPPPVPSVSLSVCLSVNSQSVSQSVPYWSLPGILFHSCSLSYLSISSIPSPPPPLVPSQRPIFCVHQKRRCRATDWRLFSFWLSAAPLHGLKLPLAAARSEPCVPRNH